MVRLNQKSWSVVLAMAATGAPGGGAYVAEASAHHRVDRDNRPIWVTPGNGVETEPFVLFETDVHGNLTRDGGYVYQYDAFNRLVEVRTPPQPGGGGNVPLIDLLYDGLGRLAATRHDTADPDRKTWHFYDGVRRIADWTAEWDDFEEAFVASATEREYVYGPDYVDEHLAQIVPGDPNATPSPLPDEIVYTLQDANYNVVALLDAAGNVLRQYSWTPYGQLDASERCTPGPGGQGLASHPPNRVGHQGLFWISFGTDSVDPNGDLSDDLYPPLPQFANQCFRTDLNGLYYSRARFYSPHLGRFLTPDPNETALPLLTAAYMNGQAAMASLGLFNAEALYGDGMNLFAAYGSNPLANRDATGLSYNPYDDWVDEQIDYLNGHRLYALGMINEGAKAASIGLNTALEIAKSILGFDLVASAGRILSGEGSFSDVVEWGLVATGVGYGIYKAYKGYKAYKAAKAARATARGFDAILDNDEIFLRWLKSKRPIDRPLDAQDARSVWEKLVEMGRKPRLDSGHPGSKWTGPHINVDGHHIPVTGDFAP